MRRTRHSHVLLESERRLRTHLQIPEGKHVMAELQVPPLRPDVVGAGRAKGHRRVGRGAGQYKVNIRYNTGVRDHGAGAFTLKLVRRFVARNVVLAIGLQGNLRKLGAGGNLPVAISA
jgi:hypothetical protein